MRAVRLIATPDEYGDELGFIIKGTTRFEGLMADRDGLLIAHDLIEHQNGLKAMGPVWDEMEALGGIWHCRGRHGDMMQKHGGAYSPAQTVAADLVRMFDQWLDEHSYCGPGGLAVGSRPHDYDDEFAEIISCARHDIPREWDSSRGGPDWQQHQLDAYLQCALQRLRSGFRKCERRFSGWQFQSHSMLSAVKDAVESSVRFIDYEGQEFLLTYGNGEAHCREFWESNNDY